VLEMKVEQLGPSPGPEEMETPITSASSGF